MESSKEEINELFDGISTVLVTQGDAALAKIKLLENVYTDTLKEISRIVYEVVRHQNLIRIEEFTDLMNKSKTQQMETCQLLNVVTETIKQIHEINERRRNLTNTE